MATLEQRFNLQDKVAVVAGGAGYLGSALVQGLAESGLRVVVLDLRKGIDALGTLSAGITTLECDVISKEQLQRCRDQVVAQHGRVDVLLNCAGTNAPTNFFEISPDEFERIMRVNVYGTMLSCQVFGEVMVSQQAGSIINFASVSMGPPLSRVFIYSAAKAGVANLTQNLAREWAPVNVRVNALRPGFFPTQWSMDHLIDEDRKVKILGHTPMGRFGKPEELLGAVLWLASDAAGFVTGSIVTVDGGFTAMTI